jgi:citron Rho-interacting kinase
MSRKTVKEASSFTHKYDAVAEHLRSLCLSKHDFELVRTIGRGHFGEVHVVRDKHSSDVYAMKTLRKVDMLAQENTAFFEEERDIMAKSHNPWITALHYGFQDNEFLYLVMDYHPGGDLLTLLSKHDDIFEEKMAQFYLSEMVEAIDSLHSFGYVHRDIKPDNVLISSSGHIKLADFGSSARLSPGSRTVMSKMPVGTPDYIAPEVLACINGSSGTAYGVKCDWWSLGICAYEMMFGQTPFTDDSVAVTYKNITNHKSSLTFPDDCDDVSDSAKDLIRHLLCDECNRFDSGLIHSHAFFAGVDFRNILSCTPPYIPTIRSIDDTSNFEELEAKAPDPGHIIQQTMRRDANKGFSGKDLPFIGFTYAKSLSDLESGKAMENNENYASVKDSQPDCQEEEDLQAQVALLQKEVDEKCRLLEETRRDKKTAEMEKVLFEADVKELTRRLNREQTEWIKSDEKALKLVDDVRQQNKQLMELRDDEAKAALEEQKQIAMQLETDLQTAMKQCRILQSELTTSQQIQEKTKDKAVQLYAKYKKLKEESTKNARKVDSELREVKQAKQESDARILQLQTKVSSMKSDLSSTLEKLSLSEKSKSKLEEHMNLLQGPILETKEETEKCSEMIQECSDDLQVKLAEQQTTANRLKTKVKELEEQEADWSRELEKMRTTSNFQVKRYKEKLTFVETAQRSAEEQLQTLKEQAEVNAKMCNIDYKN